MNRVDLPIIDLGATGSNEPEASQRAAKEIWSALQKLGFFCICNHGVPESLVAEVRDKLLGFFRKPVSDKLKAKGTPMRGYTGLTEINFSAVYGEKSDTADLCERLSFGREVSREARATDPYYQADFANFIVPENIWPPEETAPGLQEAVFDYYAAMERLFNHITNLIGLAADLPPNFWKPFFSKHCSALTGVYYPEPAPEHCNNAVRRLAEHADPNMLTILSPGEMANGEHALEIKHEGSWHPVPARPGCFIVNIGDMMEFISNGRLKATRHQVVTPRERAGSERLSVVYFGNPNYDAVFETLPSCLPKGAAPRRQSYEAFLKEQLGKMTISTPSA
ncbi:isopenicillin N synthase family dioxygenase [Sorangium sp. So ce363]|uniref:isopenicillin N synthase family dioxygenase n=1 Tax=Sorangium sp. So ce363 TaxID=3133304 RepID=UPI003F5EB029